MKRILFAALSFVFALLAAGCSDKGTSADYPADFKVVPGDGSVIATWTSEPEVEYWIFFGVGPNINTTNWATTGGRAITNTKSPQIITGLANGTVYSFTINGRKNKGPGGSGAPTQVATPVQAGENWQPGTPLGTTKLSGISAGAGQLGYGIVSVGAGGALFSGVAGGASTARDNPAAPVDLNTVTYGTFGWVAGGANGTIIYSIDATTWATRTSGTTNAIYGSTSSLSNYLMVGAGGVALLSGDGSSWTTQNTGTTNDLYAATFGATYYVAVGAGGTIVYSTDGVSWTPSPVLTTANLRGVSFGLVPSADGTTISNAFIAVGDGGVLLTSPNGIEWSLQSPIATVNLNAAINGGRFVVVGAGGIILTSTDGLTWQTRASSTTNDLFSVTRTLSGYTAVGAAGTNVSTF